MKKETLFSSTCEDWETPQDFFDLYNAIYNFDLDVCASSSNAKCAKYFTKQQDALTLDWVGRCWMNPPYGRGVDKWVKKACESAKKGALVVCLLPARTDTKWWHEFATQGQIFFIKGRLKFGGNRNNAPFPSVIVVFNGELK